MILPAEPDAIARMAARLRAGGPRSLVAFPTETVYGLGALARDEAAVRMIFRVKGRPADNPLIAHVAAERANDRAWLEARVVAAWPEAARRLALRFWPGPLALVVPKHADLPRAATGGRDTVAVRAPDHPVAEALLRAVDDAVVAPSANRSGRLSPTAAEHVEEELGRAYAEAPAGPDPGDAPPTAGGAADPGGDELPVLDGGPCRVGIESTVVDCSRGEDPPRILRPGRVTAAMIEDALGLPGGSVGQERHAAQAASPGTAAAHYRPGTPVQLVPAGGLPAVLAMASLRRGPSGGLEKVRPRVAVLHRECEELPPLPAWITPVRMPADPDAYARDLYAAVRAMDAADTTRIVVLEPPDDPAWTGVRDRLGRMAGG